MFPFLLQDMTKDQIANEKVALQKALLYYESIHGRPVCVTSNCLIGASCLVLERFYNLVFLQELGSLIHALFSSTRKEA